MCAQRALVAATVLEINDASILYPCCKQCYAKMLHDICKNIWYCMRCNIQCSLTNLSWRYRLSLQVADSSATCNISLFGGTLVPYFGCSADQFYVFLQSQGQAITDMLRHALQKVLVGNTYIFCLKLAFPLYKRTAQANIIAAHASSNGHSCNNFAPAEILLLSKGSEECMRKDLTASGKDDLEDFATRNKNKAGAVLTTYGDSNPTALCSSDKKETGSEHVFPKSICLADLFQDHCSSEPHELRGKMSDFVAVQMISTLGSWHGGSPTTVLKTLKNLVSDSSCSTLLGGETDREETDGCLSSVSHLESNNQRDESCRHTLYSKQSREGNCVQHETCLRRHKVTCSDMSKTETLKSCKLKLIKTRLQKSDRKRVKHWHRKKLFESQTCNIGLQLEPNAQQDTNLLKVDAGSTETSPMPCCQQSCSSPSLTMSDWSQQSASSQGSAFFSCQSSLDRDFQSDQNDQNCTWSQGQSYLQQRRSVPGSWSKRMSVTFQGHGLNKSKSVTERKSCDFFSGKLLCSGHHASHAGLESPTDSESTYGQLFRASDTSKHDRELVACFPNNVHFVPHHCSQWAAVEKHTQVGSMLPSFTKHDAGHDRKKNKRDGSFFECVPDITHLSHVLQENETGSGVTLQSFLERNKYSSGDNSSQDKDQTICNLSVEVFRKAKCSQQSNTHPSLNCSAHSGSGDSFSSSLNESSLLMAAFRVEKITDKSNNDGDSAGNNTMSRFLEKDPETSVKSHKPEYRHCESVNGNVMNESRHLDTIVSTPPEFEDLSAFLDELASGDPEISVIKNLHLQPKSALQACGKLKDTDVGSTDNRNAKTKSDDSPINLSAQTSISVMPDSEDLSAFLIDFIGSQNSSDVNKYDSTSRKDSVKRGNEKENTKRKTVQEKTCLLDANCDMEYDTKGTMENLVEGDMEEADLMSTSAGSQEQNDSCGPTELSAFLNGLPESTGSISTKALACIANPLAGTAYACVCKENHPFVTELSTIPELTLSFSELSQSRGQVESRDKDELEHKHVSDASGRDTQVKCDVISGTFHSPETEAVQSCAKEPLGTIEKCHYQPSFRQSSSLCTGSVRDTVSDSFLDGSEELFSSQISDDMASPSQNQNKNSSLDIVGPSPELETTPILKVLPVYKAKEFSRDFLEKFSVTTPPSLTRGYCAKKEFVHVDSNIKQQDTKRCSQSSEDLVLIKKTRFSRRSQLCGVPVIDARLELYQSPRSSTDNLPVPKTTPSRSCLKKSFPLPYAAISQSQFDAPWSHSGKHVLCCTPSRDNAHPVIGSFQNTPDVNSQRFSISLFSVESYGEVKSPVTAIDLTTLGAFQDGQYTDTADSRICFKYNLEQNGKHMHSRISFVSDSGKIPCRVEINKHKERSIVDIMAQSPDLHHDQNSASSPRISQGLVSQDLFSPASPQEQLEDLQNKNYRTQAPQKGLDNEELLVGNIRNTYSGNFLLGDTVAQHRGKKMDLSSEKENNQTQGHMYRQNKWHNCLSIEMEVPKQEYQKSLDGRLINKDGSENSLRPLDCPIDEQYMLPTSAECDQDVSNLSLFDNSQPLFDNSCDNSNLGNTPAKFHLPRSFVISSTPKTLNSMPKSFPQVLHCKTASSSQRTHHSRNYYRLSDSILKNNVTMSPSLFSP